MGLLDIFRRGQIQPAEPPRAQPEEWLRIGRLEAEVESLRLQWVGYRDELRRLALRLEKRDQRAEQKAAKENSEEPEDLPPEVVAARTLRARRGRVLHGAR